MAGLMITAEIPYLREKKLVQYPPKDVPSITVSLGFSFRAKGRLLVAACVRRVNYRGLRESAAKEVRLGRRGQAIVRAKPMDVEDIHCIIYYYDS